MMLRRIGQKATNRVATMCDRSYLTAKGYQHLRLQMREDRRVPPVIVYQMGKVGSQTISHSLRHAGLQAPVHHVHFLTPANIAWAEEVYRHDWSRARHLWASQHLRRQLNRISVGERWHVVTLTRDPVARNISSFFQVGEREFAQEFEDIALTDPEEALRQLTAQFLDTYDQHDLPLNWFDDELRAVFGIDVYMCPFPAAAGYSIMENEQARVLVVRAEDVRARAHVALKAFLGVDGLSVVDRNTGATGPNGTLYGWFTSKVVLPDAYLNRMYGSRYARHFYAPAEIKAFRARWSRAV